MKSRRKPMNADVEKYEIGKGMEDGFELFSEVVTRSWLSTDFLVKIEREDGSLVCPFIMTRRGRAFIAEGDYIVKDEDGIKHACGGDVIWDRYEKLEEDEA